MSEKDKKEIAKLITRYALYNLILTLAGDFNYFCNFMDFLEKNNGKISK